MPAVELLGPTACGSIKVVYSWHLSKAAAKQVLFCSEEFSGGFEFTKQALEAVSNVEVSPNTIVNGSLLDAFNVAARLILLAGNRHVQ